MSKYQCRGIWSHESRYSAHSGNLSSLSICFVEVHLCTGNLVYHLLINFFPLAKFKGQGFPVTRNPKIHLWEGRTDIPFGARSRKKQNGTRGQREASKWTPESWGTLDQPTDYN